MLHAAPFFFGRDAAGLALAWDGRERECLVDMICCRLCASMVECGSDVVTARCKKK